MKLVVSNSVLFILCLFCVGCSRDTIRHGDLIYNVLEVFPDDISVSLARAAARGDVTEIDRLIAKGANVNTLGHQEITPLWWAAWAENYEGFNALLDKGADPNAKRSQGWPVMHWVVEIEDPRFLEAALKKGGNPDLVDERTGETPLFRAVQHDYEKHIDLLIKAGANINAQTPIGGETILMVAIGVRADYELVWRLLQMGADYNLKETSGSTLADTIQLRAINPDIDEPYLWRERVMEFLRSKGIKVQRPARESRRTKPLPEVKPWEKKSWDK
jgi:uncharacterized protein